MLGEIRAVTVSVADLDAARALYEGLLGMACRAEWRVAETDAGCARRWDLPPGTGAECVFLEQPPARAGAVRLVRFTPAPGPCATEGARPYDHGYVKNLDFAADDVAAVHARLAAAGQRFLSPPVTYPLPWGEGVTATEAHLPTPDGVKIALISQKGAPRIAFGQGGVRGGVTEVAAATQIVPSYDGAVAFYCQALDCVPAVETVLDSPALVAALRLPPLTRLRACFIGGPQAVGGKIGLVAYEGPGVADAATLRARARPPFRGAVMLTFETSSVDHAHARALAHGATEVSPPADADIPPFGRCRASSVDSPEGILLELIEPDPPTAGAFVPVLPAAALPAGSMRGVTAGGRRWLLANLEGRLFAWRDRCPHLGGPLSAGAVRGNLAVCPWHGWQVDLTSGRVRGAPGMRTEACPVRLLEGEICLAPPAAGARGTP